MQKPVRFIGLYLVFTLLTSVQFAKAAFGQTVLNGDDILSQSVKAYDALNSYSCQTSVETNGIEGKEYHTTADIKFLRPGRLVASGTTMFGTDYGLVTDGKTTTAVQNGSETTYDDVEDGLGFVTGISQSAATTIPALLLHTQWGYPFSPTTTICAATITQIVDGHPCYEVIVTSPIRSAYWIDKKTFLIDQIASRIDLGVFGTIHELQTITESEVNPTIPEDKFTSSLVDVLIQAAINHSKYHDPLEEQPQPRIQTTVKPA